LLSVKTSAPLGAQTLLVEVTQAVDWPRVQGPNPLAVRGQVAQPVL
jgi:hypothetical protein